MPQRILCGEEGSAARAFSAGRAQEVLEKQREAAVDFLFFLWGLWGLQISGLWISGSGIRNAFFIFMLHANELTNLISLNPATLARISEVFFCLFW